MIDTKTYYMQKLELKSLRGKSSESIVSQMQKDQAPIIAYDILSAIKKGELVKGIRLGWNKNIKKLIIKWKGNWYEVSKDLLFNDKRIYNYLR